MGLIETDETNLYTFGSFAAYDFYTDMNRALVQQALAYLNMRSDSKTLTIVAKKGMDELCIRLNSEFIQGEAADLPRLVQKVDAAFFCNAIHLVAD